MFNSKVFWENNYKNNGNSGEGSYGELAQFKADIINDFISKNNITSMIDYGMGDGNQLKYFNINNIDYTGIDVSLTVIDNCKKIYNNDDKKKFIHDEQIENIEANLVISCDVIYHLIEDNIYFEYMKNLFNMSNKYVIIYSRDEELDPTIHVKFRKFTDYIKKYVNNFNLIDEIPNKFPEIIINNKYVGGSSCNFYIYSKI